MKSILFYYTLQIGENFLPKEHVSSFTERVAEVIQLVKDNPESAKNLVLSLAHHGQSESTTSQGSVQTKVPSPPQSQSIQESTMMQPAAAQTRSGLEQADTESQISASVMMSLVSGPAIEETPATSPVIPRKMSTTGVTQEQTITGIQSTQGEIDRVNKVTINQSISQPVCTLIDAYI